MRAASAGVTVATAPPVRHLVLRSLPEVARLEPRSYQHHPGRTVAARGALQGCVLACLCDLACWGATWREVGDLVRPGRTSRRRARPRVLACHLAGKRAPPDAPRPGALCGPGLRCRGRRGRCYSPERRRTSVRRLAAATTEPACRRPGWRLRRSTGPEIDTAATMRPDGPRTGAETDATPTSRSETD